MTYMSENIPGQKAGPKRTSHKKSHKTLLKQLAKPLGFLLLFIMICAFLAQYLTDSETLTEYAKNNPELAYGAKKSAQDGTTVPNAEAASPPETGQEANIIAPDAPSPETTSPNPPAQESSSPAEEDAAASVTQEDGTTYTTDKSTITESLEMNDHPERTTYQPGFYYEPLTDEVKLKITGISYPESGCSVPYEDLHYVGLLYRDFNGEEQTGELICNKAVAQDMVEIFYELYRNDYQIERIRLIDEYNGDDTASMADNNTSCFNYRVVDGTTSLSKHAYGLAIDINPFYNPYVVFNKDGTDNTYISPAGSEIYADRSQDFAYKIDENDLCYRLFIEHGFTWGGNWNSSKDYQHFQKVLDH